MKVARFEDLDRWQVARTLAQIVYTATRNGPFKQDYGFADQTRRSVTSIMANPVK
jgi:four helix bundle protein